MVTVDLRAFFAVILWLLAIVASVGILGYAIYLVAELWAKLTKAARVIIEYNKSKKEFKLFLESKEAFKEEYMQSLKKETEFQNFLDRMGQQNDQCDQ